MGVQPGMQITNELCYGNEGRRSSPADYSCPLMGIESVAPAVYKEELVS